MPIIWDDEKKNQSKIIWDDQANDLPQEVQPQSTSIYSRVKADPSLLKQPGTYLEALQSPIQVNDYGQSAGEAFSQATDIPQMPQIPQYYNQESSVIGPMAMGVNQINPTVLSELLKAPASLIKDPTYRDTFAKGLVASTLDQATTPANWLIPPAFEAAAEIPIGKTTLGTLAKIDPSKWEAAFAGNKVRIRPAFFNLQEATDLANHLKNNPERISQLGSKARGIAEKLIKDLSPDYNPNLKINRFRSKSVPDNLLPSTPMPFDIIADFNKPGRSLSGSQGYIPEKSSEPFASEMNKPGMNLSGSQGAERVVPDIPSQAEIINQNMSGKGQAARGKLGPSPLENPDTRKTDILGMLTNERGMARIKKSYENMSIEELRAELNRIKKGGKKSLPPTSLKSENKINQEGLPDDLSSFRDITKLQKGFLGLTRQVEKVAGEYASPIKERIVEPIKNSTTNMINERYQALKDLKKTVVDGFGIKEGSKESAAVFQFGEKRINAGELQQKFPKKWQQIIKADRYFRSQYDALIDRANEVRAKYGYNQISKRADYYTHIRESGDIFNKLLNPDEISPRITEGAEVNPEAKSPFNPFSKFRSGETNAVEDAVRAYHSYLNPTLSEIHLTEPINILKGFRKALIEQLPKDKQLPFFLDALKEHADALALKQNKFDKMLDENIVPARMKVALNWVTNRFAKNSILYNVSSALSNFLPMAQVANEVGPIGVTKALYQSAFDAMAKDEALGMSKFLQRRFNDIGWSEIAPKGLMQRGANLGAYLFKSIDTLTSRATWMALYDKAIGQGLKGEGAIKFADEMADKILQDRSIGSLPLAFRSRYGRIILQFQTEVNNFNNYMIHDIGLKDPKKLATLFAYTFIANRVFESATGRSPLPDPYMAAFEAIKSKDPIKAIGRISGEVLSNMVGGNIIANLYPEYGYGKKKILGKEFKTPTRKELFKGTESGRYGAVPLTGVIKDPLNSLIPPFGGSQLKKTMGGIQILNNGYIKYGKKVIHVSSLPEKIQALIFGPSATKTVRDKFNKPKGKS